METEVTCVLTEKDRLRLKDRKALAKAWAKKLLEHEVIEKEEYEWIEENLPYFVVSYNSQQSRVEFRVDHHWSEIAFRFDKIKYDELSKKIKQWRKKFATVHYLSSFGSAYKIAFFDRIPCDGEYRHGQHIITVAV